MKRLALLVFLSCSLAIHADELDNPSVQPIPSDDLLCLSLPGFRFGLGSVAEDSAGVQIGGAAVDTADLTGIQFGLLFARAESFRGWQHGSIIGFTGTPCGSMSKLTLDSSPQTRRSHGLQTSVFVGGVDCLWGVQLSVVGATAWEICGLQLAIGQAEAKIAEGLQISLHTVASDLSGLQIGLYNEVGTLHGAQVGLVNLARAGSGIQIGLANGFGSDGETRWLPLLNARF